LIPKRLRRWETLVLLVAIAASVLPLTGVELDYGRAPHGVREGTDSPAAPYVYHGFFALLGLYCLWNLISPDENADNNDN
jgi:hypothetical protein